MTQPRLPDHMNYARAMQQGLPQLHTSIISQAEVKTRQILIDKDGTTEHYPMAYLSEQEITTKVMLAIQLIGDDATDRPSSFRFLGAKKLQRGATILVLATKEAAAWLKQDSKMAKFMEFLGGSTSCFRLQNFLVLGMFVPITFDNSTQSLRDIEQMAALNPGDIILAKWIKLPNRWAYGQQTGHMIVAL